jgi:tetratricopeptide (TPR) repeat protein
VRWLDSGAALNLNGAHLLTHHADILGRLGDLRAQASNEDHLGTQEPDTREARSSLRPGPGFQPHELRARGWADPRGLAWLAALALLACGSLSLPREAKAQTQQAAAASPADDAFQAQRYNDAARLGLAELARNPDNHALRLRTANSLAWTGQYPVAADQYRALLGTPLAGDARVGLANLQLWQGQPARAHAMYRQALDRASPGNTSDAARDAARQGLANAERQLRPMTSVRLIGLEDSSNTRREAIGLQHRWRDASRQQAFEVGYEGGREERTGLTPALPSQSLGELSLGYQHQGWAVQPRVRVTIQDQPRSRSFWDLGADLFDGQLKVDVGRVNWGKLVFDPRALQAGLTADRLGVAGRANLPGVAVRGSFQHFKVSDGNTVQELDLRLTPSWQPLQARAGLRGFAGLYSRTSERSGVPYWSPVDGYHTGYVGVLLEHSFGGAADSAVAGPRSSLFAELKRSLRTGGEGASGWSAGMGGRVALNADWALRADAFHGETRRDASSYRSTSVSVGIERQW